LARLAHLAFLPDARLLQQIAGKASNDIRGTGSAWMGNVLTFGPGGKPAKNDGKTDLPLIE
jgi:hypothetical protein